MQLRSVWSGSGRDNEDTDYRLAVSRERGACRKEMVNLYRSSDWLLKAWVAQM